MLKLLPGTQVKALQKKDSSDDKKKCDCNNPPMHARLTFAQTIAKTADSFDGVASLAQFFAQPADVGIDGTGIDHAFVTPDIAEQAVPLLHPAAPLHQSTQQFVLEAGEVNYFTIDGNMMAHAIDSDRAGNKRLRFGWSLAPAQNRVSTQHDFARGERF